METGSYLAVETPQVKPDQCRFWYERPGQFSPDQLLQLKKSSLSRIICDNSDSISRLPQDAFLLQPVSEFSDCSDLPSVDLDLWTECKGQSIIAWRDADPTLHSIPECISGSDRDRRSVLLSSVVDEVQQLREAISHLEEKVSIFLIIPTSRLYQE